jgi:hypothetical protein
MHRRADRPARAYPSIRRSWPVPGVAAASTPRSQSGTEQLRACHVSMGRSISLQAYTSSLLATVGARAGRTSA